MQPSGRSFSRGFHPQTPTRTRRSWTCLTFDSCSQHPSEPYPRNLRATSCQASLSPVTSLATLRPLRLPGASPPVPPRASVLRLGGRSSPTPSHRLDLRDDVTGLGIRFQHLLCFALHTASSTDRLRSPQTPREPLTTQKLVQRLPRPHKGAEFARGAGMS